MTLILDSHPIQPAKSPSRQIFAQTMRFTWLLVRRIQRDIAAEIERRRGVRLLQELDDRTLADIGLTRGEVGYPPSSRALPFVAFSSRDTDIPHHFRGWM